MPILLVLLLELVLDQGVSSKVTLAPATPLSQASVWRYTTAASPMPGGPGISAAALHDAAAAFSPPWTAAVAFD